MRKMSQAWMKYFIAAGLFGFCINLIYLALPVYVMVVYDRVLYAFSNATLYALAFGLLISLLFMGILEVLKKKMMAQAGQNLVDKMLPRVIKAMPLGYDRGVQDLDTLKDALAGGRWGYWLDLPWMLFYLWVLYVIHPLLGAVALGAVFMAGVAQGLLHLLEKRRYTLADVAFYANDQGLQNIMARKYLVAGMGLLPAVAKRYLERNKKTATLEAQARGVHALISSFTSLVHLIGAAGVFTAGAYVFFLDEITAGAVFAGILIAFRLFYPLEQGLASIKAAVRARGAYTRLKAYLPEETAAQKFSLPEPEGRLTLEGAGLVVGGKTLLNNISLDLAPGQFLSVVGPSCAGKTALCRMILGILPPVAGKIRVDGAQISHWPEGELGRCMGYLPQEPALFEGSVAENIARLGPVDSDRVVEAAQKACAHELILKLPQGYDTKIEANGRNLASSQKQMISLARALYGSPKLLVLDAPHTYLDKEGFRLLVRALNQVKQEKITLVMVTDKTNFLAGSDKILLIKEGQTAMYGPAKDVLAQLTGQQPQAAAGV